MPENLPPPYNLGAQVEDAPDASQMSLMRVDATRLYALLKQRDQPKSVGDRILKALITDVMRARLGFSPYAFRAADATWERNTSWQRNGTWERGTEWSRSTSILGREVTNTIQALMAEATLSEEELAVVRELDVRISD
jgi:hypothetical protein